MARASGHFQPGSDGIGRQLAPCQSVGTECCGKMVLVFPRLKEHLEEAVWIGIVGVVVDDAALNVVRALVQIDEVVVSIALILYQAQVRLVPVVAVDTGCEADALEPAGVLTLAEVPHPELVADAVYGAVVDDALAVGRAIFAEADGDARAAAGGHVAFEVELHAALERQAVVVEGKEDDFVQVLARSAVLNVHH